MSYKITGNKNYLFDTLTTSEEKFMMSISSTISTPQGSLSLIGIQKNSLEEAKSFFDKISINKVLIYEAYKATFEKIIKIENKTIRTVSLDRQQKVYRLFAFDTIPASSPKIFLHPSKPGIFKFFYTHLNATVYFQKTNTEEFSFQEDKFTPLRFTDSFYKEMLRV